MSHIIRLVIISGRSGSGKSSALAALEDQGFTASITCRQPCSPTWSAGFTGDNQSERESRSGSEY